MFKIAIVGAGPAGSSAAVKLLRNPSVGIVRMFDRSLVPWGLLRTGVAPDHPEVKATARAWTAIGNSPNFHFYGGVNIGNRDNKFSHELTNQVDLSNLIETHDAILLANGSYNARRLAIPGSDNIHVKKRVFSAQEFVGYYNADPYFQYADITKQIDGFGGRVGLVGGGNVALDIARLILCHGQTGYESEKIRTSDINSQFLETIRPTNEIHFFIRRGPFDLTCTTRELRELTTLPNVNIVCHGLNGPLAHLDEYSRLQKSKSLQDRKQKRLLKVLAQKELEPHVGEKNIHFWFYHKPEKFIIDESDDLVCHLQNSMDSSILKPVHLDYLIESLGYERSPVDERIHIVDASTGRAKFEDHTNVYMAGWALSGAKGVVGDSTETARTAVESILEDLSGSTSLESEFQPVTRWRDWMKISEEEVRRGIDLGKGREKIKSFEEMLKYTC